ncbi:twin-arginine translocase TatA/TatE family subunit [Haloferax sp. Atlit-12N]|uniref:Sec-independent protein translocase subunit TatA/TatB n=1 Tax=Haloferax sp. Atlit-12N TaxID=2077203 RepID=UPI000E21FDA0|nr:twin-arginine translocase TatA/TatE family subunit [Haloferax sp. Atlit-12N]RDZ65087.1 twin-arginine translocase TatA/TatE family subunit [Haloferax sp. Atlit-12N]
MFETITPLFPGLPGGPELLVVLLIVVLLFGANKIPKLARSSGQAIGEFQRGREEIEDELQDMKGDDEDEDDATTESSAESVETESTSTKSSN